MRQIGRQSSVIAWPERLLTLALALGLDLLLGEPPAAVHPVVGIGTLARLLERRAPPRVALASGAVLTLVVVGVAAAASGLVDARLARLPVLPRVALRAALLKPAFAVRALLVAAEQVRAPLERGGLVHARTALHCLVSRDPTGLDASLVAAAAVESLAENASDSIIAPWLAYLVGGVPGAYLYRAANTLDARIGYHGRYEHLGRCAARLDDLLNLVPSRLTSGVIVVGAAVVGQDAGGALRLARRDHAKTASPNAGWPMGAMAGALRVQLEKVGHYRLGDATDPVGAEHIATAEQIILAGLAAVGVGLATTLGLLSLLSPRRQPADAGVWQEGERRIAQLSPRRSVGGDERR